MFLLWLSHRVPLAAVALALTSSVLQAQNSDDWPPFRRDVHLRNDCRLAHRVLTTGRPRPHHEWALGQIVHCGPLAGDVVATALRASSSSAGSRALTMNRLVDALWGLTDASVFNAALETARDPSFSESARIQALRLLVAQLAPSDYVTYERLIGASDDRLAAFHQSTYSGDPLPQDFAERIVTVASTISAESTASEHLRNAASYVRSMADRRMRSAENPSG
jgi:hypothetical protein